jgi:hypothetical protein
MKKLLFVAALMAATAGAFAQGTVNFANKVAAAGLDAPVLNVDGSKLAGAAYLAQLYAGPTAGSLAPVGASAFPFKVNGYFSAGELTIPGTTVGGTVFAEVRAWAASGGATYEAALSSGAAAGKSEAFTITGLGGNAAGAPPATPANMVNMKGFQLQAVPEPSTIALGALGAFALLAFRRK